jgi:nucleoside-diphosphate-sugar epimerase
MVSMRKKIFLLGGTGFIGSALTRQLVANRQEYDLLMLLHRSGRFRDLEQVNTHTGALGSFGLAMLDRFKPDAIVHLARMSGRGGLGRALAAWRGVRANRRIISHLGGMPRAPHVIYVSGSLVYGDCGDSLVDEERPLNPIAFAREYHRAEQPWEAAMRAGNIPVTILRPPWIMGRGSWFAEFYLKSIRSHGVIPLFGNGTNLMSLIDVEDCAGLIAHAVQQAKPGNCYNLFAPGACLTQRDFAERLADQTGAAICRYEASEIGRRYGRAFLEAFTFSNHSATRHPELIAGYKFKHPSVAEMIRNNIPSGLRESINS